jgi:hypothetical protein
VPPPKPYTPRRRGLRRKPHCHRRAKRMAPRGRAGDRPPGLAPMLITGDHRSEMIRERLWFSWGECQLVDPYQIRRDLVAMRSRHSGNDAITAPINKLLGKIAHMREADSPAREAELNRLIDEAAKQLPAGIITGFWHEPKATSPAPLPAYRRSSSSGVHPSIRRDLALLRQLDHVNTWRIARRPARPAFQRRLKFPDRWFHYAAQCFRSGVILFGRSTVDMTTA